MGTRAENSFELIGKTINASGRILALENITAVRRKTQYRPRLAGLVMLLAGVSLWAWSGQDASTRQQARQAKFAHDFAAAEQEMGTNGDSAALTDVHPLDISQALNTDEQLKKCGQGLLAIGFLYAFLRRKKHYIMVTTGGQMTSVYWTHTLAKANQIVEEIAAKMG